MDLPAGTFIWSFETLGDRAYQTAIDKGFTQPGQENNIGEVIALCHSELSEVLEAIRHGNPPDDKIPEFTGAEAELADCVIRIMHLAAMKKWRVADAIVAKMAYNKSRPYKHGKQF